MKIIYMGTPEFAVLPLRRLVEETEHQVTVITQPAKAQGRKMVPVPGAIELEAIRLGLDYFCPVKVSDPGVVSRIQALEPDLIVTCAYGQLLPRTILDIPRWQCINIHPSLLPLYRGASPIESSLINGDKVTGTTLMLMEEGLDCGPILIQEKVVVNEELSATELREQLSALSAELLLQTLPRWFAGELELRPQEHSKATKAYMLSRETGRLNFNETAEVLHNRVRGTQPWPGAYALYQGERMKIMQTRVLEMVDIAEPGTIIGNQKSLIVATASGALEILILQPASRKMMSASVCAHNYPLGSRFDCI